MAQGYPSEMIAICVAIGIVAISGVAFYLQSVKKKVREPFLNKTRQKIKLVEKTQISHDTVQFRFGLPHADQMLGLPVGNHFKLFCPNPKGKEEGSWNGRGDPESSASEIERKYTPVSGHLTPGEVSLIIKVYKGGVLEQFPDGGKMSQFMGNLKVGDDMDISGPWGLTTYKGNGVFGYGSKTFQRKEVGMMAGGTGLTPMLAIIQAVLADPEDKTKLSLIYANQTADDILCREQLETLQSQHPDQFKLWYTVDRPTADWKYDSGFINVDMIQKHLPAPGPDTQILICGPPPMVKYACKANLEKAGYPMGPENLICF